MRFLTTPPPTPIPQTVSLGPRTGPVRSPLSAWRERRRESGAQMAWLGASRLTRRERPSPTRERERQHHNRRTPLVLGLCEGPDDSHRQGLPQPHAPRRFAARSRGSPSETVYEPLSASGTSRLGDDSPNGSRFRLRVSDRPSRRRDGVLAEHGLGHRHSHWGASVADGVFGTHKSTESATSSGPRSYSRPASDLPS
jgi:hypothetical protein